MGAGDISTMATAHRFVCVHAHFYQPPRENPWLETVEVQPSAAPFHDWNDRVTSECYAPNGASRILNAQNEIIRIINNYSRISFNFGPTLLSWLQSNTPRVYRAILEADAASQRRFSGHGSAMAQAYNHIILPLASRRDKITQIRWGIADFRSRFQREPEGMWLPETAVDLESLDIMAEHRLKFVVLAPHQCKRIRRMAREGSTPAAGDRWGSTADGAVPTTRAYKVRLLSGRAIAAFFYDGPRSRAIAFEGLLNSGEVFYNRLVSGFNPQLEEAQIVHVATDGESYGHHHRYGDMALAWMLQHVEQTGEVQLTNYSEFLANFPPQWEAEIEENTSWSCAHGIERWRSDCGCNTHPGWSQQWRAPLRQALDWLRDSTMAFSQRAASSLGFELDRARDGYINVVLARNSSGECENQPAANRFLSEFIPLARTPEDRIAALKLMELERHALLMFTSCGWFFDEISGIETVQIITYAARVLQLAAELFGPNAAELEDEFIRRLTEAHSNVSSIGNGSAVYRTFVQPQKVGLKQVGAHYAISSVFTSYPDDAAVFCYSIRRDAFDVYSSGRARLVIGRAQIQSRITEETGQVLFVVLHLGDHNLTAAVKGWSARTDSSYDELCESLKSAILRADVAEAIRIVDRQFAEHGPDGQPQATVTYSLTSLFQDEQRRILSLILRTTLAEVEAGISAIYETQASLLHFLSQSQLPKPQALLLAANFAVNAGLRDALRSDVIDAAKIRELLAVVESDKIELDRMELGFLAGERMKQLMVKLLDNIGGDEQIENALALARTLNLFPFDTRVWQAQNLWYQTLIKTRSTQGISKNWTSTLLELGRELHLCSECLWADEESTAL
jgi:alpha-amylase/alpha-mannosidase (GH57 family)